MKIFWLLLGFYLLFHNCLILKVYDSCYIVCAFCQSFVFRLKLFLTVKIIPNILHLSGNTRIRDKFILSNIISNKETIGYDIKFILGTCKTGMLFFLTGGQLFFVAQDVEAVNIMNLLFAWMLLFPFGVQPRVCTYFQC